MGLRHAPSENETDIAGTRRLALRGVLFIAALSLACNVGVLAVPLFNMQVFNRVLTTRDTDTLRTLALGLAIGLVCYAVLDGLRGLALEVLAGQVARRLSSPLICAVVASGRGPGAASEALADLETLRSFFSSQACVAPFDLMWAPVMLLVLLAQHWAFAALGLASCALLAGLNVLGDAMSRQGMLAANTAAADALRGVADTVNAAEVVLANGMLPTLAALWEAGQRQSRGLVHRSMMRSRAISATIAALRMGMTGAMVALGLLLALGGAASGGAMVASNMILAKLLMPFQQISGTRRAWVDALAAWTRIRSVMEHDVPLRMPHAMPAPAPRLVVDRLVYVPPGGDRALLRGISFTAEPGECVGVVGPSSAGKSTLVRMIMGMTAPTAGGVYLDGTSTYLWQREDFAARVGYVPQSLALLDATVLENICRLNAPDIGAAIVAAKRVGVHRTIAALPLGYATRLAGSTLSSGQRQRVALARALYALPGVLVLDEPTAYLDRAGEAELMLVLAGLRAEGVTVVLVTHRPALLSAMDTLVVLQDGLIAHVGPRDAVLQALSTSTIKLVRLTPSGSLERSGTA